MKKALPLRGLIAFIMLLFALPSQGQKALIDQDRIPLPARQSYLTKTYSLTYSQVMQYERLLADRAAKMQKVDEQPLDAADRKVRNKIIETEFKNGVKALFDPIQYEQWIKNNKDGEKNRRYRENLGMDNTQIARYKQLLNEYRGRAKQIREMTASSTQKKELEKENMNLFRTELSIATTPETAEALIDDYLLSRGIRFAQGVYSFMTYDQAARYTILKTNYFSALEQAKATLTGKERSKTISRLSSQYRTDIKKILSAKEFSLWDENHTRYDTKKFIKTYQLTAQQLNQYRSLLNYKAIEDYKVNRAKLSSTEKTKRKAANRAAFEEKLKKVFSAEQFALWKEDNTIK